MAGRVLFVDDDANVLKALERVLRSFRNEWHMAFATTAAAALDALDRQRFDVIVADLQMPGMDGAALLDLVTERHPDVIRIILSGQINERTAVQASAVAHECLSKPCDPGVLRATIAQALSMRTAMTRGD